MVNRHQKQCYKMPTVLKRNFLHFPLKYLLDCSYIYTEVKDLWASIETTHCLYHGFDRKVHFKCQTVNETLSKLCWHLSWELLGLF